jgi:hypothetical protein
MYFADPDGNGVELQVDNFPSVAALQAWFATDAFAKNPIGVELRPGEAARALAERRPRASSSSRARRSRPHAHRLAARIDARRPRSGGERDVAALARELAARCAVRSASSRRPASM